MWTLSYWKQLFEGSVAAGAFAAATALGADAVNWFEADWKTALGLGLGTAVLKVLYGLGAAQAGTPNTPSVVRQDNVSHEA